MATTWEETNPGKAVIEFLPRPGQLINNVLICNSLLLNNYKVFNFIPSQNEPNLVVTLCETGKLVQYRHFTHFSGKTLHAKDIGLHAIIIERASPLILPTF